MTKLTHLLIAAVICGIFYNLLPTYWGGWLASVAAGTLISALEMWDVDISARRHRGANDDNL